MAASENPLLRQLQERLAKVKQENSADVGLKSEKKEDNPSPKRVCNSTDRQLKALPGNTALVKAACSKTRHLGADKSGQHCPFSPGGKSLCCGWCTEGAFA